MSHLSPDESSARFRSCWLSVILLIVTAIYNAPSAAAQDAKTATVEDLTPSLFQRLDKNHDAVLTDAELADPAASRYAELIKKADRDGNKTVTREEYGRAGEKPFYRNPHSLAVVFLIVAFGCFCMFLDGLLEPERRDYFWIALGGCLAGLAGAYVFASSWFLNEPPYLAFAFLAPALVLIVAVLAGATREAEVPEVGPIGPVVHKIGNAPATTPTKRPATGPRRPGPPPRTPRPAPVARPPVPDRRPQPPAKSPPTPQRPTNPPKPGPKPPGKT